MRSLIQVPQIPSYIRWLVESVASARRSAHIVQLLAIGAWMFVFYISLFRFKRGSARVSGHWGCWDHASIYWSNINDVPGVSPNRRDGDAFAPYSDNCCCMAHY